MLTLDTHAMNIAAAIAADAFAAKIIAPLLLYAMLMLARYCC